MGSLAGGAELTRMGNRSRTRRRRRKRKGKDIKIQESKGVPVPSAIKSRPPDTGRSTRGREDPAKAFLRFEVVAVVVVGALRAAEGRRALGLPGRRRGEEVSEFRRRRLLAVRSKLLTLSGCEARPITKVKKKPTTCSVEYMYIFLLGINEFLGKHSE